MMARPGRGCPPARHGRRCRSATTATSAWFGKGLIRHENFRSAGGRLLEILISHGPWGGSENYVHFRLNPSGRRGYSRRLSKVEAIPTARVRATLEREVIEHFAEISRALGQPRSLAEIYGLLFISPRPLAMDELIARLQISQGSVSQGLKFLRDIGAVRPVAVAEDRRVHYEAVAELRRLAGRFLRDQLAPRVAGSEQRLERLADSINEFSGEHRAHLASRVTMLRSWHQNTRRVLPLVIKLLGS